MARGSAPASIRLTEAIRALEHDGDRPLDEPAATEQARSAGGDLAARIMTRAAALTVAPMMRVALGEVGRRVKLAVVALLVLGLITGAAAARAALGAQHQPGEPANFYLVLLTVLLLQTVLLLVWIVLMVVRPRGQVVGWLGSMAVALGRWLAARTSTAGKSGAAMTALMRTDFGGRIGGWTLSAISHAVWVMFNVGALVVIIIMLSTRQYSFIWETTILSEDAYVPLTESIAALPELVGFETPTTEQIRASQKGGDAAAISEARTAWSYLLVGSIVLYGFAPRLLMLALCLGRRRGLLGKRGIDVSEPGFARLRPLLMPAAVSIGVVDPDDAGDDANATAIDPAHDQRAAIGAPAALGFEIGTTAYARQIPSDWTDLGAVRSGLDQQRIISDLAHMTDLPRRTIIIADLTNTPDRGAARFLREVHTAAGGHTALILSRGQQLRERGLSDADIDLRLNDWRAVATGAGIATDAIHDLDLDHITSTTAAKLAAIGGGGEAMPDAPPTGSRFGEASAIIVNHAAGWNGAPTAKVQAKLHREIAALYAASTSGARWRALLELDDITLATVPDRLTSASRSMIDLLPGRLKSSPRWLAAGAMAGAMGCVAAATLAAPAAIGALPIWAGLGAAVTAAMQLGGAVKDVQEARTDPEARDLRPAADAAALFALILDLQGHDEHTITRILDDTLREAPDDTALHDADDVRVMLDELTHRYDIARTTILSAGDSPS